eukprot:m.13315 g.13315  ORF g.13315 m.13315 type:complete len:348 (+) comp9682_c0_seq1:149-1192(+)
MSRPYGSVGKAWCAVYGVTFMVLVAHTSSVTPTPHELPGDALVEEQWRHNSTKIATIQLPAPTKCGSEAKSCTYPVDASDMAPLVHYIAHAAADNAQLLLAPEYHMVNVHLDKVGDTYTNSAIAAVAAAAKQAKIYVAVGAWVLWNKGTQRITKQYTNSILIFGRDGHIMGMYNKTHAAIGGPPFFWPPFENDTEWNMVFGGSYPVFDLDFARIGIQTCYDGYFPETMRAIALQGAEIVLWPNSRGGNIESDLVSASSFFNVVHIAAVNSGNGGGSVLYSNSMREVIAGPCALSPAEPCYLSGVFDLHTLRVARKHNRMFHQRRPKLAQEFVGEGWLTSQFYANYPG